MSSYVLWQQESGGPDFQNAKELSSVNQSFKETEFRSSPEKSDTFQQVPERPSVKYKRFHNRGVMQREMESYTNGQHSDVAAAAEPTHSNILRIIKIVALLLIAACTLVGTVFSKISFVSITGRMYSLYTENDRNSYEKSQTFVQLVFVLIVPDILCFFHCLVWGVIGKTNRSFPWPRWRAMLLVRHNCLCVFLILSFVQGILTSVFEVAAICGFVFGVACKLPPGLTILVLNGVFWFVIAKHFFWDMFSQRRHGYNQIENQYVEEGICTKIFKQKVLPVLELFGFILQVGALIAIPILLSETEDEYKNDEYHPSTLILLPVTLSLVSLLWSGWLQEKLMESGSQRVTVQDEVGTARLKAGQLGLNGIH